MGKPDSSRKSKSLFNLLKWHSAHEKRSDVDGVGSVGAIEARVTERTGWVALPPRGRVEERSSVDRVAGLSAHAKCSGYHHDCKGRHGQ